MGDPEPGQDQGQAPAPAAKVVYTSLRKQSGKPSVPKNGRPSMDSVDPAEVNTQTPGPIKELKSSSGEERKAPPAGKDGQPTDMSETLGAVKQVEAPKKPSRERKPKTKKSEPVGDTEGTQGAAEIKTDGAKRPMQERKPVARPSKPLTDWQTLQLEVEQLRIRFPDLAQTASGDETRLEMTVPIEDPEFPFDLDAVRLRISVPKAYPSGAPASYALLNEGVPLALKSKFKTHMDAAARTLLGQQALRPMLRFLEKNLETMLTPPANPTGFKFVPATAPAASPSPPAQRVIVAPSGVVEYRKGEAAVDLSMPPEYLEALRQLGISEEEQVAVAGKALELEPAEAEAEAEASSSLPLRSRFKPAERLRLEPLSRSAMAGTIQLQLQNLTLRGIGLLVVSQLGVLMRCQRCHANARTPIEDLRPDADRIYKCVKCSAKATLNFRMDAVHEQSSSAGYLRCHGGQPSEMMPSTIQATCGRCAPDTANGGTVKIERVQVGERVSFDCPSCHQKASFEIGRVDWVQVPGLLPTGAGPRRRAVQKLPSQVGEPLPERGACKHYRKSFRWFRFPCCGMAYPCDTCHDEDPANSGHKAEWASRQICGACSREMAISQKECACGVEPASTRHSAHWEGGKGMRDQTQMSKKDNKKYRNVTKPVKPATK